MVKDDKVLVEGEGGERKPNWEGGILAPVGGEVGEWSPTGGEEGDLLPTGGEGRGVSSLRCEL